MGHQVDQMRPVDIRDIALTLLRQGERSALAGLPRQAEALLAQVWTLTIDCEPELANTAAWELAWLLIQMEAYDEATAWFSRVESPPADSHHLWPIARQSLVQVCQIAARRPQIPAEVAPPAPAPAALAPLPRLWIINLGRFQVARDGVMLPASGARKPLTILRYLLTRHHYTAQKDELMELLWPEASPREAAHSLHVAVSALRRYLDVSTDSYVLFTIDSYALNPEASVSSDCLAFQQLCDEAEQHWRAHDLLRAQQLYARAIDSYQGDYYVDAQDMAWASVERERLLARYLVVLDRMGRIFIEQEQFELAIGSYQRLLERDSFREDAHCQIMRCYQRFGQRGLALRQYERCATILANELGLEPTEEARALYQALLQP